MHISLRKAVALLKEIQAAMPTPETVRSFSIYSENVYAELLEAASKLRTDVLAGDVLTTINYEIRNLVAEANVAAGIHKLVALKAHIESNLKRYQAILANGTTPDKRVVDGTVQRALEKTEGVYSRDSVSFSCLLAESKKSLEDAVAVLRREKTQVQDQLLEANIKGSIKLSDETVGFLQLYGLLD